MQYCSGLSHQKVFVLLTQSSFAENKEVASLSLHNLMKHIFVQHIYMHIP